MMCNDITALSSQFQKGDLDWKNMVLEPKYEEPKYEEPVALDSGKHNKQSLFLSK